MKNKIAILMMSVLGLGSLTSCVDLDSDKYFEDRRTLESVFTNRQQTQVCLLFHPEGECGRRQ